jgi:hypothetical protein
MKKRRIITTEKHEIWIIRQGAEVVGPEYQENTGPDGPDDDDTVNDESALGKEPKPDALEK